MTIGILFIMTIFMNGLLKVKYIVGDIKNDAEINENFLYESIL